MQTHYDNLKVSQDAPIEVIQAAYRSLAKKYHPDVYPAHPDAERIMRLINTAYEVLRDPVRRKEHDAWISRENGKNFKEKNQKETTTEPSSQSVNSQDVKPPHWSTQFIKTVMLILRSTFMIFRVIAICSLVGWLGYILIFDNHRSDSGSTNTHSPAADKKIPFSSECAIPMETAPDGNPWPKNPRVLMSNDYRNGLSSLTLDNSRNSQDLLIKLTSVADRKTTHYMREAFIPAGKELVLTSVPAGNYVVKMKDIKSGCAQVSEPISLYERQTAEGTEYSNSSLTFYPVVNGNTQLSNLPQSQF